MKPLCQIFFLSLLILFPIELSAQFEEEEEPISAGWQLGLQSTTRGWGGSLHYLKGADRMQFLFGADLNIARDSREFRTESFFGTQGRNYVLGKLNHLAVFSPSIGIQRDLFSIGNGNLLNTRVGAKVGPTIGILTPYFLEIFSPVAGRPQLGDRVVEAYDPDRHTYTSIIGRASIFDHDFNPEFEFGLSAKVYGMIDFSNNSTSIRAVQIGVNADWFASPVPIMADFAETSNSQLFIGVQLGLLMGNRW